ncbi:MAG: hypothetical protein KOO60_09470 [Gemmatimonadales bacterium]|nr:hypothetical protein [Gemmatimonadales bacterium]
MRWIDINLSETNICQEAEALMADAERLAEKIIGIQARDGLDNRSVVDQMQEAGRNLFKAVLRVDQEAFHVDEDRPGSITPEVCLKEPDELTGYHITTDDRYIHLPWNWLHNGLEFLTVKNPVCVSTEPSRPPEGEAERPWMQRMVRADFLVGEGGSTSLKSVLSQMKEQQPRGPEVLFVPGHTEEAIRRLIYREAEAIELALDSPILTEPLARLEIPGEALTPSQLPELGLTYQAIHFAGPTSQPARPTDVEGEFWINRLVEEATTAADGEMEKTVGLEGEVLGVDPITSLLDDVGQKAHHAGREEPAPTSDSGHNWLLPDGPVGPEGISRTGGLPPLVFSNSYCALPDLGPRFTNAGASTFIGPQVPLFSRPARIFAGYCYKAMGEGWCAGAAVWKASQACRRELGEDHPAWLSYGLHGYGSLALQYL